MILVKFIFFNKIRVAQVDSLGVEDEFCMKVSLDRELKLFSFKLIIR